MVEFAHLCLSVILTNLRVFTEPELSPLKSDSKKGQITVWNLKVISVFLYLVFINGQKCYMVLCKSFYHEVMQMFQNLRSI